MIFDQTTLKDNLSDLFATRQSKLTNKSSVKKFRSVWGLIDAFDFEHELKLFLCREGDCSRVPYLFASIFFNYHTDTSTSYLNNLFNQNRNLQGRKKQDFAFDLIIGWIFELIIFKNFGLKKSGCDYDYMLEKGKSINSGADFVLGNKLIELVVDNNGLTCHKDVLHLRYSKWDKLLEDDMFLFVLCPNDLKYYFYYSYYLADKLDVKRLKAIPAFSKFKDVPGTELTGWNKLDCLDVNRNNLNNSFKIG
jgi:hypothetical protein